MAELLNITHNAGNLNEYTSVEDTESDLSATVAAALASTAYGLNVLIDNTTGMWGMKTFTQITSSTYRFRFYIDPNTISMADTEVFVICQVVKDTSGRCLIYFGYKTATGYFVRTRTIRDNTTWAPGADCNISDAEHYVEVRVQYATGAGDNNGTITLWIDGVQVDQVANQDIYDISKPNGIRLGAITGIDANTDGTLFLDELVFRDDGTEIGAVETAQTIELDALTLAGSTPSLSLALGAITLAMDALTLASSAGTLTWAGVNTLVMDALTLASTTPSLILAVTAVTLAMDALTLAGSAATLDVNNALTIALDALTLTSSAQTLTQVSGAASVALDALTLVGTPGALSVDRGPEPLKLWIDGVDYTDKLVHESLVILQTNDGLNSTCTFDLVLEGVIRQDVWTVGTTHVTDDGDVITGHVALPDLKVEVSVVEGATVYFAGVLSRASIVPTGIIDVRDTIEPETQLIRCGCHDFNSMLEESVIDTLEEYTTETDEAVIDDIFAKYVTGIDFATFVDGGAFTFRSIFFENITVRQALDQIVARTGYVWYVDYSKKLHYSALEANDPLWHLSDVPDQVDSFSYLDKIRKEVDATNIVNMVFVVSADSADWFTDEVSRETYGDHKAIVRDARLSLTESIEARATALLTKFKNPVTTYALRTYQDGLRAGMNLRVVCAFQDIDETLLINRLKIKFPVDGEPIYELTLGGLESSAGGSARRLSLDRAYDASLPITPGQLPVGVRGWAHNLEFSSVDENTVEWGAGTITTANGQEYSIAAGNTDDPGAMADVSYVYLDLTISSTELQITTDSAATVGTFGRILLAVCAPSGDASVAAMYQVFGGGTGTTVLIVGDNIAANCITANEIAANTITATEISVAQLSAISANMGTLTAGVVTILNPAGGGRVILDDDGIRIYNNVPDLLINLDADDGSFTLKSALAGDRVELDTSGLRFYDGANLLIDLNATNATFSLKSGVAGSARIEISNSEIVGYDGADVKQFYLNAADGKAYAGAGAVVLDEDGVHLSSGETTPDYIRWETAGDIKAQVAGFHDANYHSLHLQAARLGGYAGQGRIFLEAQAPAGQFDTELTLLSGKAGATQGSMEVVIENVVRLILNDLKLDLHDDLKVRQDARILGGLYVGADTDPDVDDVWCDGEISTDGGTTRWHLQGHNATGDVACSGYIDIQINGTPYRLMTRT